MTQDVVITANGKLIAGVNSSGTKTDVGMVGDAFNVADAPYAIAVTPSDVTTYDPPLVALRVGTSAGDISVVSNGVTVVIPSWQLYEALRMEITQVLATGTTATGITGWQAKA